MDPYSPTPLHAQLAAIVRQQIRSGELKPLDLLPSEKSLAQEHGIARGTVRRAMEELRRDGLIFTLPQRGTYVQDQKHPRGTPEA